MGVYIYITSVHVFVILIVQASEDDDDLPLRQVLKIVDYLFKHELFILAPGNELTVPSINLLTSIFLYCEFVAVHERYYTIQ